MRYGARSLSLSARRSRASLRSAFISAADTLKPSSIQMSASPNENTVPPHFLSLKRASSLVKGLFTAICGKLSDKTVTLKSFAEAVRLIFLSDFTERTKCTL